MTATVTKNTGYLVNGPGGDVAAVPKVNAYLVIDTGTVVDPGEAPVIFRKSHWWASLARRPKTR